MTQASLVLLNTSRTAYRAAHNNANLALVTHQSGASEPSPRYAYQFWADTTTGLLKIRNAANSAWVTFGTLASANLGLLPLTYASDTDIVANTSDGADNKRLSLAAGGSPSSTRGAFLTLYGNEGAGSGGATLASGDVASAVLDLVSGSSYLEIVRNGGILINDHANANNTLGFTINQVAADDEILSLKSSDVAHGLSDTETDTFAYLSKRNATGGGLILFSGIENGSDVAALIAIAVGNDDTTKTTSGNGIIDLRAYNNDGTATKATPGADSNLLIIRSGATTRFIFDQEGSFHADVGSTTFDRYDDVALLNAFDWEFQRRNGDPIKAEFMDALREGRTILQREKVVNYYDEDGSRAFVNFSKLSMLLVGAVRQQAERIAELETPIWKRLFRKAQLLLTRR
jgi:hypothetical protein